MAEQMAAKQEIILASLADMHTRGTKLSHKDFIRPLQWFEPLKNCVADSISQLLHKEEINFYLG